MKILVLNCGSSSVKYQLIETSLTMIEADDDRALATLEVLMDLAAKTQVIFFTHHQHLATLSQRTFDDGKINIISLPAAPPSVVGN